MLTTQDTQSKCAHEREYDRVYSAHMKYPYQYPIKAAFDAKHKSNKDYVNSCMRLLSAEYATLNKQLQSEYNSKFVTRLRNIGGVISLFLYSKCPVSEKQLNEYRWLMHTRHRTKEKYKGMSVRRARFAKQAGLG